MTRLTQNDISRLLAAVQQVHSHTDFSTLPHLMVELQSQLVSTDMSSYTLMDKRLQRAGVVQDMQDVDVEKLRPQFMAHYQEHPIVRHSLKTTDLSAVKVTDFLTQAQFERTGYYNEFSKWIEVRFQLIFYLFNDAGQELAMTLNRRSKDFSERDRTIANLLRPHFAQAYQNARAFTELRQREERTQEVLKSNQLGLMFLTGELKIGRMTGNCESWLNRYFARRQNTSVELPDRLRRWVRQQRDFQSITTGSSNTRPPLTVEGLGANLVIRFSQDAARNVTLLFSEQRRLQADSFAGFGLTRREQEVLLWIAEGKSNPEISRILGISARTVDKHVEHLLAKLKVESRRAAMLKALAETG